MMTEELFRDDAYVRECTATITAVQEHGIILDRSVFYPIGGGQPGDSGSLYLQDATELRVVDTSKAPNGQLVHHIEQPTDALLVGSTLRAIIDWERRYRLMRMHTCLHLLCALIPAGVTGGSIRDGSGRLDFDLSENTLNKDRLTLQLQQLVEAAHPVRTRWISDQELAANPSLVRTMSVQPPHQQGWVRLLDIEGVDLQPCGGTHVANTREIGAVRVRKIEKKGRQNRRVNVELA